MDKRKMIALSSGLAIVAASAGGLMATLPAHAESVRHAPASQTGAVEDGTNDGETNDDGAVEDGTNDGETADDGVAQGGTNDSGLEDGTNDGETADD